ncbi:hypothetical protein [Parapedobacter soli]|uniref:hypothetical protein n=1 Tax=Parapedobacter soli TaxID=416955 RepID=UPI0021CACF53|nr:hypothetical protein [Parapedobacter soli]
MESLFIFLLASITNEFRRSLHTKINWKLRMIGIKVPRGAGKADLWVLSTWLCGYEDAVVKS